MKRIGNYKRKHSMYGTSTYETWASMRARIFNPNSIGFKDYGGRGLGMDPRWSDFREFLKDMGVRPEGKTIGRKDNERGYFPDNCCWEDCFEQARNKRNNHFIELDGKRLTLAEWSRIIGCSPRCISQRLKRRWTEKEALLPVQKDAHRAGKIRHSSRKDVGV